MKKHVSLLLALTLLLTTGFANNAFALNYKATLGNEATFETYTEARENGPAFFGGKYAAHPVMADYPGDTTYIYRSPDMFGINAAVRMNTNIVVYTDKTFASKDEARAYLDELGLPAIVDGFRGSVILVTPSSEAGFTAADQKNYYALQTAMFAINASATVDGTAITCMDASYYGGFGFYYLIGIDGGADFINNYVAGNLDYISRVAGLLLINGKMERISTVAAPVPAYLINADETTVAKYCAANGADAVENSKDGTLYYNQALPVRKVFAAAADAVDKDLIAKVYYDFLIKAVRGQEMKVGLNSASTPYQGYGNDQAPYSLSVRNALINGVTADGIHEITTVSDALSEYKNEANGEYLETWYEYLPEEVLDGTAPEGSIPLLLSIHGGGDDPRQYVDGQGWLVVAGKERLAIVAPDYSSMSNFSDEGRSALMKAFPALVRYMLDKYPALDASRVYVNGYSMGSLGTCQAMWGDPGLFAAAFPQAGVMNAAPREEDYAQFADIDLPICISTSEYDLAPNVDPVTHCIVPDFYALVRAFLKVNEMEEIPEAPDFETYPMVGFDADITGTYVMNGEYTNHYWRFLKDGVPMVGFNYIDGIVHCLYPEYASMVWDFVKHYSRDLETGAVIYNPYRQ